MEDYPEDLRTPPLPLVALLGLPELHSQITHLLRAEQPPLSTVSIFDLQGIGDLGGKERRPIDARLPPPVGILKAGWMLKHRQRTAAVVAACLERDQVYGDPNQWASVCSQIDTVKAVCRVRNMKLMILIVQPLSGGEANEDRLSALRKRAEIDARCCLTLITQESMEFKRCVARLGSVAAELASIFYKEEGKRVKARLERRSYSSPDLSVRYNFKIAVYAEFRKDWGVALKHYEAAYLALHEAPAMPLELQPLQRMVEVRTVAEHIHFKVCTLLLHRGKEVEAVKWFRQHIQFGKRMVGPPEGTFLHAAWLSRQFKAFAELLQQRLASVAVPLDRLATSAQPPSVAIAASPAPVSDRELQPAFYFQLAAKYVIERRCTFQAALVTSEAFGELDGVDLLVGLPDVLGPPLYVGQPPRILSRGPSLDVQRPTEAEYLRHALQTEKLFAHSHMAIDLLAKAHDQYKRAHAGRMICQLGFEMGREYSHAGEYANARRLFDSVAGMFRKESWVVPLAATLNHLRDCARRLGLLREYVEYSLELAALPVFSSAITSSSHSLPGPQVGPERPLDIDLQERIQAEIVAICSGAMQDGLGVGAGGEVEGAGLGPPPPEQPLVVPVEATSPLRCAFSVAVAFHSRVAKPSQTVQMTVALVHHLPRDLRLDRVHLCFNDASCDAVIVSDGGGESKGMDAELGSEAGGSGQRHRSAVVDDDLEAPSGLWKRWTAAIRMPSVSGRLECTAVELHLGAIGCIRCLVEGGADAMPLWSNEAGTSSPPFREGPWGYVPSPVIDIDEADALVALSLECREPAMVGELLPVRVGIMSTGHPIRHGTLTLNIRAPSSSSSSGPTTTTRSSSLPHLSNSTDSMQNLSTLSMTDDAAAREDSASARADVVVLVDMAAGKEGSASVAEEDVEGRSSLTVAVPSLAAGAKWGKIVFLKWASAAAMSLAASLVYSTEQQQGSAQVEPGEGEVDLVGGLQGGEGSFDRHGVTRWQVREARELTCEEPWLMSHQFVAPFRRDSLLLLGPGREEGAATACDSPAAPVLALGEGSTLAVTVRSGASVDLRLLSVSVVVPAEESQASSSCSVSPISSASLHPPSSHLCRKDEALAQLFRVTPHHHHLQAPALLNVGTVCIHWVREIPRDIISDQASDVAHHHYLRGKAPWDEDTAQPSSGMGSSVAEAEDSQDWPALPPPREVVTTVPLPAVAVVQPPLVVTVECPPHALLGVPFALTFRVRNTTPSLQALGYLVVDAPGFVLSGPHSGAVSVLPSSTYSLAYILVPIAAGNLQLPQIHVTAVRYKAKLHPAPHSTRIFVYPSAPRDRPPPPLGGHSDHTAQEVPFLGAFKGLALCEGNSISAMSQVS